MLFCANLCDAQVEMYMGSAMGKTRLGLKGITCQGHLMLDSQSRKDANGGVHVSACALTAEEGIVGGEMALTNLNADRECRFGTEKAGLGFAAGSQDSFKF